jgi:hypothetical protein
MIGNLSIKFKYLIMQLTVVELYYYIILWQSSFSKISYFMSKNKGKLKVFEKLDCNLQYS